MNILTLMVKLLHILADMVDLTRTRPSHNNEQEREREPILPREPVDDTVDDAALHRGPVQGSKITTDPDSHLECREELRTLISHNECLEGELTQLNVDMSAARKFIKELKDAYSGLEVRAEGLEAQVPGLKAEAQDLANSLAKTNDIVRSLRVQAKEGKQAAADLNVARAQLEETTRALNKCQKEQNNTTALLTLRTAELRDAQEYMGKSETVSHADVKRALDQLNSEIFQTSAQLTDTFPFKQIGQHYNKETIDTAYDRLRGSVGETLAHALWTSHAHEDPFLAQITLQARIVARANSVIRGWDLGGERVLNNCLQSLHESIFMGESQAVSARWRTLTTQYSDDLVKGGRLPSYFAESLQRSIIQDLANILLLAGTPWSRAVIVNKVRSDFGERISAIVKSIFALRWMIREEVKSSDFVIIHARHDAKFHCDSLENVDQGRDKSDEKASDGSPVLCTTELGLRRLEKRLEGGVERVERTVIMRAKVALCSMVQEYLPQETA
ncbi:hypothetical protein BDW22DRAFT_1487442 [Trametopsis cervina]|nr:hypothetical protein BDW22DRAFT_1487442 [Trametopsis cervina]